MNMEAENVVCPVCTLFLRPGITLKEHLASHPKVKVIEALVRLSTEGLSTALQQSGNAQNVTANVSNTPANIYGQGDQAGRFTQCGNGFPTTESAYPASRPYTTSSMQDTSNQNWQGNLNQNSPNFQQPVALNQSIIYQQIMSNNSSTSGGIPQTMLNNLSQQYVTLPVPGMFNPSLNSPMNMMNSNYMYHQQQVIMTSGNLQQPTMNMPVMPQINIGVPVTQIPQGSQFNQPRSIEASPNCQVRDTPNLRIVPTSNSRCIEAPPPLTTIEKVTNSKIVPPKSNIELLSSAQSQPNVEVESSQVSTIRPTLTAKTTKQLKNASTTSPKQAIHKSCKEVVLIRESNYISPFNRGPYRAIMANPQSGVVIEEIDPLSTTPSSSPTPMQQQQQNYEFSTSIMPSTPEPPKVNDAIDITEHSLKEYEETDIKSALPETVANRAEEIVMIDEDQETITPDIQCAQDLRTFCRSPVNEIAIRAPVIASCRSPPQQQFNAPKQTEIPTMCSEPEDNFLSLDCFDRERRLDKSLSDPPFDPLTDNIVLPRLSHRGSNRKSSHDDAPPSPTSSVGSDFSLRVRKDLQPQSCDENSQNIDCFSPKGLDSDRNSDLEQGHKNSNVICSIRDLREEKHSAEEMSKIMHNDSHFKHSDSPSVSSSKAVESEGGIIGTQESLIDMNGVHLMLSNDFMNAQSLISQVNDFECMTSNMSQNRVLMNIGGMHQELYTREKIEDEKDGDRNITIDGVNIHADERMPPRGELSEAESNGACDISWNRVVLSQEGSSSMSNTYDLFARESWEASDVSDSEAATVPAPIIPKKMASSTFCSADMEPDLDIDDPDDPEDTPLVIDIQEPPLNFKCKICGRGFGSPKDRKAHLVEEHCNMRIPKPKKPRAPRVRKPPKEPKTPKVKEPKTPKPKQPRKRLAKTPVMAKATTVPAPAIVKTENNFENLLASNNLKVEKDTSGDLGNTEDAEGPTVPPPIIEKKAEQCAFCQKAFFSAKKLKDHQKEEHDLGIKSEFRYTCSTCEAKFITESSFNVHLKEHPLECNLCGKYFYRRVNLKLHVKRHMGLKPHKCDTCSKAFITKQKLEEHINTHTGAAPIKCTMCEETFRRYSNLVQHRNRHHLNIKKKVKDYICHCGEIYHSKKKLLWHKEIHDLKPKACTYCREKFIHMSSLTRHMRRAHNQYYVPRKEREAENVECPICKGVYLKSSIESHMRTHSGQKLYQCTICNKDFTTKWNLKLHKWTHASRTSKPYKCELCNGAFIRQTDYIAHMNSHKSVKPYTCNYCGCQFIRKYNCQRHVKEHEEGKSYNCNMCGKSFHRSYYLKEHMRVHTGARPYTCHICGKTSTTKSNHNKHVRIHHAREPVSTEG